MIRIGSIKFMNTGYDNIPSDKEERRKHLTDNLKRKCAKLLKISVDDIHGLSIVKHSIDARKKPEIFDLYTVDLSLKNGKSEEKVVKKSGCKNASVAASKKYIFPSGRNSNRENKRKTGKPFRPVIIGAGPAGLFCAYELALSGYCPIVLERGMDVDKRSEAVESFWKGGQLLERTNVQFGEGGAGTFSDGKLNTMVKDKAGRNQRSLEIFVENGADSDILYEAKPHIGTDVLRKVVKSIREKIIERGGEVLFETKVTDILFEREASIDGDSSSKELKITGVRCEDGREFASDAVVLAIGHSARDTFSMLNGKNVKMEQKPFAVGLRVEHPQTLINESQYGQSEPTSLPPSPYKVTAQTPSGHGVYSFCMCPGGYVVNASSEEGRLCVNGMSYSGRDSRNANSAIIVTVDTKDFGSSDVLAGVEFQRRLEEKAYEVGQGKIPVEYFDDYKDGIRAIECGRTDEAVLASIKEHEDSGRNKPCMKGDYTFAPVHRILPVSLGSSIVYGMEQFGRMIKGFDGGEALLSGVEARTSSPVRILRDENLEAVDIEGLYPCGEGAGYAGGITSAAIDGIKTAEQIAIHYFNGKDSIRALMIEKRCELTPATKKELDLSIMQNVITSEEYEKAENILAFCSMKEEADTRGIIEDALKKGKNVFCPRVTDKASKRMEFIKVSSMSDMREGAYGITEPISTDKRDYYKEQKDNTLMIIPGLCFDRHGNRLGFGAGYYDRFINRFLDAFKNGIMKSTAIGYNFQVTDDFLDEFMDKYDVPVGMIITDKEIIRL